MSTVVYTLMICPTYLRSLVIQLYTVSNCKMENYNHKHSEVEKSHHCPHYCWWLFFLMAAIFSDTNAQTVTVTMNNAQSNVSTDTATLVCEFGINDASYAFRNLVWINRGTTLAHFFGGAADPTYLDYCSPPGPCSITRDSSSSQFHLSPVDFDRDNGNGYECQVTYKKGAGTLAGTESATLTIVIPINTMVMSNGSSSGEFTDGGEVTLSPDETYTFQCVVAGINPRGKFTWTVGVVKLEPPDIIITEDHVVDSVTGLTTSTSNAELSPKLSYNKKKLRCEANNYEGDPGVKFSLVLKVEDPCDQYDSVQCENGGSCYYYEKDQMTKCNCTEGYSGVLCETGGGGVTLTPGTDTTVTPQETTMSPTGTTETTRTPTGSTETTVTPTGTTETTVTPGATEITESLTTLSTSNTTTVNESTTPTVTLSTVITGGINTTVSTKSATPGCTDLCIEGTSVRWSRRCFYCCF